SCSSLLPSPLVVLPAAAASACSAAQVVPTGASSTSLTVSCAAESEMDPPLGSAVALPIEVELADLVVTERLRARVPGPVDSHAARATTKGASPTRKRGRRAVAM